MKTINQVIRGAAFLGLTLFTAQLSVAGPESKELTTTTETSSTTSLGTVSEFGPETIVVRSSTSSEPVRYSYSKTTTYVDESGAPVSLELVKSGLPVTVHYVKVGDRMVASRVIVRKVAAPAVEEVRTKTTTTTEKKKED